MKVIQVPLDEKLLRAGLVVGEGLYGPPVFASPGALR